MARAQIVGTVVDTDRNEWNFNNRSGVAYSVLVRGDGESPAVAATRVKVTAEQFGGFQQGEHVELPVDIFANTIERQGVVTGAKLSITLREDYSHKRAAHSAASTGSPSPAGKASPSMAGV